MRNSFDDDGPEMNRPAKWERHRPAAERVVGEAAAVLGMTLPEGVRWIFWLKALAMGNAELSLATVVAALAKAALRPTDITGLRNDRLGDDEWAPNADGRDGERAYLVARMIDAELTQPGRPFLLYKPSDLLDAVDDALASGDGDAARAAVAIAKTLSATGCRRELATLPEDSAFLQLAAEMPNFHAVIQFYAGQTALARLAGRRVATYPPVLLLGPPGIGKTRLAEALAAILGTVCRRLPMSSTTATWIVTGLDRSWSNGKPGLVYTTLASAPVANVVVLVDEIDKAPTDPRYDPMGGMYALLEHDTAQRFIDEYVAFPVDASAVIWIATANDATTIPEPIRSRFIVFEAGAPDGNLARQIVVRLFERAKNGVPFAPLDEAIIDVLVHLTPREALGRLQTGVGVAAQRACNAGETIPTLRLEDLQLTPAPRLAIGFV